MQTKSIQTTSAPSADEIGGTRIAAAMTAIKRRIAARSLTPGDKLPSIRSLAKTLGMSGALGNERGHRSGVPTLFAQASTPLRSLSGRF